MEATLLAFSERRLARLFRRVALQHIRRELGAAEGTLGEAAALLSRAPGLAPAIVFVREWGGAIEAERKGAGLHTAPAAWIHLGQELAEVLDAGGDWVAYLESRWKIESGKLGWAKRAGYGILAGLAFTLSAAVLALLARHAVVGSWEGLGVGAVRSTTERALTFALLLARVAGTVLLIEQGGRWAAKALRGKEDEPRVFFLGGVEALPELAGD